MTIGMGILLALGVLWVGGFVVLMLIRAFSSWDGFKDVANAILEIALFVVVMYAIIAFLTVGRS